MSNLSNLHISGSYKGLINLADSTQPLVSQSGDINLQDGLGDNVGVKINAQTKKVTIDNDLRVDGNTDLNGDVDISGSLTFQGNLDVQGNVTGYTASFDTINTRVLHVTEESASVIFSSGSNTLGDEPTDVQILSGSVYIPNLEYLAGNVTDTNTRINNKLNRTEFNSWTSSVYLVDSSSFDSRIDSLEVYTSSNDSSISHLNSSTSSLNSFTSSADQRLTSLESFTGSLVTDFVSTAKFNSYTSSINSYTSSTDDRLSDIELTTASLQSQVDGLSSKTGSYATTGSNTLDGTQVISGSVQGNVESITIASSTASIDCSLGNFFTVTLPTGETHFRATNIQPGQTISLKVNTQTNTTASIDSNSIRMIGSAGYTPTQLSSQDILTFVSFDSSYLYGVPGSFFG